jgi:hypothetical protein
MNVKGSGFSVQGSGFEMARGESDARLACSLEWTEDQQ